MDPKSLADHFNVKVFTTEGGEHPQARCFADADAKGTEAFFIAYQPRAKNRYYMWFPDYQSFVKPYEELMGTDDAHFYEVIRNTCRFFIDVDAKEPVSMEKMTRAIESLRPRLKNYTLTTSHGADKWSYHLVYPIVDTMENHKAFITDPATQKLVEKFHIDDKVYTKNRNMRLLGSSKYGSSRFLVGEPLKRKKDGKLTRPSLNKVARGFISVLDHQAPKAEASAQIQPSEKAFDLFADQPDRDCFSYSETIEGPEGITHKFRRLAGSHCQLCKRTHDNDNTTYLFETEGKVFRKCYKGKGSVFLGRTDDQPDEFKEAPPIDYGFNPADLIKYNERYCSNNKALLTSQAGIIAQRARMGTGKTNAAAQRIRDAPDKRVLVISFRISLTAQYLNDKFEGCGMVGYSDVEKLDNSVNRLVIQPESMHRLKWTKKGDYVCDEVIIDECSQVIRQLTSTTFTKQKNAIRSFKVFKQIIKYAKTVHIMDANLTARHIKFFQALRGGSVEVYWNEYNNFKGRSILMAERPEFMKSIYNDVEEGRQVYIACNGGENKIQALKMGICAHMAKIHKQKPYVFSDRILTIYQGSMSDPRVIKALENPNEEWGKYSVVIASPSVQSGVSYDQKGVFHRVYGMFTNFTNSSEDASQMLCRVRHPAVDTMCCVEMRNNNIGPRKMSDMIKAIQTNEEHLLGNFTDYEIDCDGVAQYQENDYFKLWANNEISRNYDLLCFKKNFIKLQEAAGFFVVEVDNMPTHAREKVNETTGIGRGLAMRNAWELLRDAPDITDEQADAIKAKLDKGGADAESVCAEDMTSLKRFNIVRDYEIDPQAINAREKEIKKLNKERNPKEKPLRGWFQTYSDPKKRRVFKNTRLINRGFAAALQHIKEYEQKRRVELEKTKRDPEKELSKDAADMLSVCDMINNKNRYKMWAMLIDWVQKLGFEDVGDEVDRDDLKEHATELRDGISDLEKVGHILGKSPHRLKGFSEGASFANILRFINGAIGQLGLVIKAERRQPYVLAYAMVDTDEISVGLDEPWKPRLLDMRLMDEEDCDSDDEDQSQINPFLESP